jgi:hypothetical protein
MACEQAKKNVARQLVSFRPPASLQPAAVLNEHARERSKGLKKTLFFFIYLYNQYANIIYIYIIYV